MHPTVSFGPAATQRLPNPYRDEPSVAAQRLRSLEGALDWPAVQRMATPWVQAVRDNPPPFWAMESLLREYPISSAEGLALMRLAEALLRVPDAETAIALTADQLGHADFDRSPDPMLARLSSAAIALSKHFLPDPEASAPPGLMARLGARTVVAATLRAVQLLGRQFVLGQRMDEALREAATQRSKRPALRYSYDMLGEGARTQADAQHHWQAYQNAISVIAATADPDCPCEQNDGISIKLSALHPRYEAVQRQRVLAELVPQVWVLCEAAARANINLTIDAEEVDRLELSLDVFEALLARVAQQHPQWRGFGLALQAYQLGALELVEHVLTLARRYRVRLMCRLVKGAYWDAEIKRAQELGLSAYPVFTHKAHTDLSYLACARALLAEPEWMYAQFASHNAATLAAIVQMAQARGAAFELQRLHGMGEGVHNAVMASHPVPVRVYAPVGAHKDLLAYLVRRLLENGANSSFVHQLADARVPLPTLLASPLQAQPHAALPLPPDLMGPQRANSLGLDLALPEHRAPLLQAYAQCELPAVQEFDEKNASSAVLDCLSSYQEWSKTPVQTRAEVLRRAADALQQQLPRFAALLVREARKTWQDAVGEVREAIDFLRYYAAQAPALMAPQPMPGVWGDAVLGITGETNTLVLRPRGVWVCISPWNFPLAIFLGQVSAALVTGNGVLAKPAEQTPAVAQAAVALLYEAGVPQGALRLLCGPGETVGAALVAAPGIAGVVFTGSTAVARHIARSLAAKDGPIVPLIAETGGINAMIVDSTALPEQVCDAVLQSAFRSAGQRCSALRVLCVHADIADAVLAMLRGAMAELRVGDPADFATDVGPLIDTQAHQGVAAALQRAHGVAHNTEQKVTIAQSDTAQATSENIANLMPPQCLEVAQVSDVHEEIFGPVLQVVRWRGDPLAVVAQINALGYGLTLGIQTRIDSRALALADAARVGNVYINRNQIGAVVGVQPFGGEGLSGTGPKAGGPHYLLRFCAEQVLTINTTAAGGNVQLLA
ncbi:MAG: bifunctional proline dehydrogenase/L-glutamate gamma-semialdehyde dehydrogenase PutA [Rhodoferax sp.]